MRKREVRGRDSKGEHERWNENMWQEKINREEKNTGCEVNASHFVYHVSFVIVLRQSFQEWDLFPFDL